MKIRDEARASALIVGAAVLWGLIGPFSVWAAREGLSATEGAFWRTALAAPAFGLMAGRTLFAFPRGTLAGAVLFGATGIAIMYVAFFVAVLRAGVGVAAVLLYTGPAWVALYEWVAQRQRPAASSVVALLCTITGVVLVSYLPAQLGRVDALGVWAGLASGVAYATHYLLGRHLFRGHTPAAVLAVAMVVAALVIAPVARPTWPPIGALPAVLFLSLAATFLAGLLFARGVVQVTPVRAAITATIEPVVALVVSVMVLQATLHAQQLGGAALILAGVTMIMVKREERNE